jgi:carbon monoxide dehydrogenase subunit G
MDLSATTMINAPVESVYAFVSDPSNDVHWRTGVTESGLTTDPPLGRDSEGFVKVGSQIGRWKVTAIDPDVSVDWDLIEGPYAGSGGYRLEDVDGSTRFTLVADVEPLGFMRLLGPLFARMGRRQNQGDVETLRSLLEV